MMVSLRKILKYTCSFKFKQKTQFIIANTCKPYLNVQEAYTRTRKPPRKLSEAYTKTCKPYLNVQEAYTKTCKLSRNLSEVYDLIGKEVKMLVNEVKSPGNYSVDFNGSEFSSGIYFYRLTSGEFTNTKKFTLIK